MTLDALLLLGERGLLDGTGVRMTLPRICCFTSFPRSVIAAYGFTLGWCVSCFSFNLNDSFTI
jgi:hypothetical protein